jgi:hypothetical protein
MRVRLPRQRAAGGGSEWRTETRVSHTDRRRYIEFAKIAAEPSMGEQERGIKREAKMLLRRDRQFCFVCTPCLFDCVRCPAARTDIDSLANVLLHYMKRYDEIGEVQKLVLIVSFVFIGDGAKLQKRS